MAKFDDFVAAVKAGVIALSKETLKDFKDEALSDTSQFLQDTLCCQ